MDIIVTVTQACELLGKSIEALRQWDISGKLPSLDGYSHKKKRYLLSQILVLMSPKMIQEYEEKYIKPHKNKGPSTPENVNGPREHTID